MRAPWTMLQDRFSGEDVRFLPVVAIITLVIAAGSYFVTAALFR